MFWNLRNMDRKRRMKIKKVKEGKMIENDEERWDLVIDGGLELMSVGIGKGM